MQKPKRQQPGVKRIPAQSSSAFQHSKIWSKKSVKRTRLLEKLQPTTQKRWLRSKLKSNKNKSASLKTLNILSESNSPLPKRAWLNNFRRDYPARDLRCPSSTCQYPSCQASNYLRTLLSNRRMFFFIRLKVKIKHKKFWRF